MKVYALYLPQFHETSENNEWWGKGFTEWTNVKKAKPLYRGHEQPKHPLNDNYYNILEKSTVEWQTELMHEYRIDGFIYYHYYFNGNKILEKPAENLLKWKEINQPFFFNWANHTWNRSWKGSTEVLIKQTYGNKNDWREHFEYLLPFFNDHRYIKINNKPVFIIYDGSFLEKKEMFECFDEWCKESGFEGLYLIEECFSVKKTALMQFKNNLSPVTKQIYYTQPLIGRSLFNMKSRFSILKEKVINRLNQKSIIKHTKIYKGDDLLNISMKNCTFDNMIPGLFFEWDNTPRHSNRGFIIRGLSKETFFEYMNFYRDSNFMILNAWNEWCEGMMLEPTKELGYKYLEWIRDWKNSENDNKK
ncbi:glycosyltransferase WbsX family protein [Acetobacterium woodii]|uniref:Lipopolysaccharide biosynthesis protein-like protein n=1 Tax=Acetobacterium woodii (strain ATCC 29683 / DSM 1030 / JCM 2381 / KCTC 1655 / WB1) TaxID=931626 RepID=H6LEL7_ACEWD|nr:glycoside hydrolase family 99-like domain-containing protein [Acetobacterium woodii]AFA48120.1 lipopolysaccharide biosynthesis protein-like protein [Acetobacterium woodii DSM 1030]